MAGRKKDAANKYCPNPTFKGGEGVVDVLETAYREGRRQRPLFCLFICLDQNISLKRNNKRRKS